MGATREKAESKTPAKKAKIDNTPGEDDKENDNDGKDVVDGTGDDTKTVEFENTGKDGLENAEKEE